MKLVPLYRARFTYPEGWEVAITGPAGTEEQHFYLAEGRCEGRISGRFRGENHPRRRTDLTFVPDFHGVIETSDGAVIFFEYRGYGRAYPAGKRQIVASARHLCGDDRYRWLNDVVCAATGEVRARPGADSPDLLLDVAELVWEPVAE